MVNVSSILLVPPANSDPHGLLDGGVCRSRPPLMFRRHGPYSDDDRRLGLDRWSHLGERASDVDCGLVLAHAGKPAPEGTGRTALVLGGFDCLGAYLRRGDQNERAGTGRWWLDAVYPSQSEGTRTTTVSYGDFGAGRPVNMHRPEGIGGLLDVWALGKIAAASLLVYRLVLLDADGREVQS